MKKNIDQLKMELIRGVLNCGDIGTLQEMIAFLDGQAKGWWDELSEAEKADIEAGLTDSEAGRVVPADEVFAKYGL